MIKRIKRYARPWRFAIADIILLTLAWTLFLGAWLIILLSPEWAR